MQDKSAEQTLQEYIRTASSTHQDRIDFLAQANAIINADYIATHTEVEQLREDQAHLNHEIDALINSFTAIDAIEADIVRTEANIDLIGKTVNRLNKRIIELKKSKGKKK